MQRGRLGLLVILLCPSLVDAAGLGPWTLQTSMNVPRSCHALAAVGDRIYAIGGGDNSNITPAFFSVEFADVDASGTIGPWSPTTPLQTARYNVGAVGIGDKIYVVGGWDNTGAYSPTVYYKSVEIASVNPDGTIAGWSFGSNLVEGMGHGAVATNGLHLYHVGGFGGAGGIISATVQVADINADGSLSAWRVTSPQPEGREGPAATIADGRLYVFGGLAGPPILATVLSAPILATGDLGAWRPEASMSVTRYHPVAFAGQAMVFVGGGSQGPSHCQDNHSSLEEAAVGADGVLGAWMPSSSMNVARYGLAGSLVGRVFVATGGNASSCSPNADTESAECLDCGPLDTDQDGVTDDRDNCPQVRNDQRDSDGDSIGDACDDDADGDEVQNADETCVCLDTPLGAPVTVFGCGIDQACPCAAPLGRSTWRNHSEYVGCVKGAAHELETAGVMTRDERRAVARTAAQGPCGR